MKKAILGLAVFTLLFGYSAFPQNQQGRQKLGGTPGDQRITREVRHQLLLLPYYTIFDNLEYQVNDGTVTLLGQVVDPVLKGEAEGAVKGIEGVDKVVNNIEILPPSPMDEQIRHAEARAIYSFPTLYKYGWGAVPPIHIIVKGSRVTLVGVVDNEADKNAATIQAKSVPNVFSVTNDLRVVPSNHK